MNCCTILYIIRSQQQGEEVYLFNDGDIVAEMEKHHILVDDPEIQTDEILTFLQCYEAAARNYGVTHTHTHTRLTALCPGLPG